MKKCIPFALMPFLFLFPACDMLDTVKDLAVPEALTVRTAATYELPAGEMSISIKEKIGIDKITEVLGKHISADGTGPTVYEYNPELSDSSTFTYIINYPIKEIPISISSDSNVGDAISFSPSFPLPDLTQSITDSLTFGEQTFPIVEPGDNGGSISDVIGSDLSLYFDITAPDFQTMVLRSGGLAITLTPDDASAVSDDFSLNVKVTLVAKDNPEQVIASSGDEGVECSKGNSIYLDLTNATLVPNLLLLIDGSATGGSPLTADYKANTHVYTVSMGGQSIAISEITGLNMDLGSAGHVKVKQEFPLTGLNDKLKSASIKKGSLSFSCELPEGWSGVSCSRSVFMLYGGINLADDKFDDVNDGTYLINRSADLSGMTITPAAVDTYNPEDEENSYSYIDITLQDARIVFSTGTTEVTLHGVCQIEEIGEIIIDIGELQNFSDSIETGINISTLIEDALNGKDHGLLRNVFFKDIDGYLFITQPTQNEVLSGLAIKGSVSADYKIQSDEELVEKTTSLFNTDEDGLLMMRNSSVTLKSLATEDRQIQTDELFVTHSASSDNHYSGKIRDGAMDSLLNDKPNDLKFTYSLALSGADSTEVKFSQEDLSILNADAALSISIAIVLPLQLVFDDISDDVPDETITIDDVLALTGHEMEGDLLDRNSSSDLGDAKKYVSAIKSMKLKYTIVNTTPLDNLRASFVDTGSTGISKAIETSSGSHVIEFKGSEIEDIFNNYPFSPVIRLEILDADGVTVKSFKRSALFSMQTALSIETDGTIEVWNKND